MKEININIEGYNVNGICVGCLNYNRKMFYDNDVKECYKLIGDIDVPDGLTIQVCWECLAAVKNIIRFQNQILSSYDVLIGYSQQHTFLNSPEDFTKHASTRLISATLDSFDSSNLAFEVEVKDDVKDEVEVDTDFLEFELQPKNEPEFFEDTQFSEGFLSQDLNEEDNGSSDEDIQLSKLKKKKDKKNREKKKVKPKPSKPSRKLKNLPSEIVELVTLSEEEMWSVRAADVASQEFSRLRYKCADCVIGFNTQKLMDYHLNGKHKPKSGTAHECDVCKAYFLTRDNLSVHRALHAAAYRCARCSLTTTLKRVMRSHECARRVAQDHKCVNCDKVFSTKSKLLYHKSVCHQERPQCDCCGKVFANKMTLKYHLKIVPQNKDEKPKEKLYIPCKGCSKVFHSKKSYRAHVVIHDGVSYPCPTCGKLFQWKRNLARHARAHRDRAAGAAPECRACGKSFASRDCYNNHMRLSKRHAGPNTYVHECNYCGKKFPTKWCMVDHIDWDHLKRVKYQCSVCFKAFKTAKIMVAHMNNIHEGKKREAEGEHLCDICGKSYKTVKRLKGHVWAMHTQRSATKNFKCKLCAATFLWQTSIYKHVRMMHDNTRTKPPRPAPVKKQDPYSETDLNRMYFQQNLAVAPGVMPHQTVPGGL